MGKHQCIAIGIIEGGGLHHAFHHTGATVEFDGGSLQRGAGGFDIVYAEDRNAVAPRGFCLFAKTQRHAFCHGGRFRPARFVRVVETARSTVVLYSTI